MDLFSGVKLKTLDLFSGVGLMSYGLEKTSLFETTAFCEIDIEAQRVLRKHWPTVQVFSDVEKLAGSPGWVFETYATSGARGGVYDLQLARQVDIIAGGFPCQDISTAGSGLGLEGSRSGLWGDFLRLISLTKPKGVLIENVAALRTRGLEKVLQGLLSVGYDAEWHCIPASYVGAPHERDRIWIIAHPSSLGQQGSWRPLQPFNTKENFFGEASGLVNAFQRAALPFVCGRHDGDSNRVDRLKQLGNSLVWPIVSVLGAHLYDNLMVHHATRDCVGKGDVT